MSLVIRPAKPADEPFLWRMLATTANLPPAVPPLVEAVQRDPGISPYLRGWGRSGDAGVLAETDGEPVGAAWFDVFRPRLPATGSSPKSARRSASGSRLAGGPAVSAGRCWRH